MRQVLFAVVLIGASFLGGTFVNGPGLKWLQGKVLGHVGMSEEVQSLTLPIAAVSDEDSGSGGSSPARSPLPAESAPPARKTAAVDGKRAAAQPASSQASAKPDAGAPQPEPDPASGPKSGLGNVLGSLLSLGDAGASARKANPAPEPSKPTPIALASRSTKSPTKSGVPIPEFETQTPGRPAPLDPSVTPAFLASLSTGSPSIKVPVTQASTFAEPRPLPLPIPGGPEDLPVLPVAAAIGSPSMTPNPSPVADEWGAIRQKLRTLGVTRYTIEGEPGGRVSFSCLIPMAGRQAVTQRFEAEGDDEIRAARAALRRIALWQATERDRSPR